MLRQTDAPAMLPPLNEYCERQSGRRYGRFAIEPQARAGALQMNSTGQPVPRIAPIAPDQWSPEACDALAAFPKSFKFVMDGWNAGDHQVRGMNVLGTLAHYPPLARRSEEHTSELQSLMRISYAVFCLRNKIQQTHKYYHNINHNPTDRT